MYLEQQRILATHVRAFLREKYDVDLPSIVIDQPPKVEMGEFAMPFSFELAKRLRKAPRQIAQDIVNSIPVPEGFEKFEVAGAGYINARLNRNVAAKALAVDKDEAPASTKAKARPMLAVKSWSSTLHQSQQGGAHRPSAQRHPRRYVCPPAAGRRAHGRRAELHRQHRRASR